MQPGLHRVVLQPAAELWRYPYQAGTSNMLAGSSLSNERVTKLRPKLDVRRHLGGDRRRAWRALGLSSA